jgi:hypothetical protein
MLLAPPFIIDEAAVDMIVERPGMRWCGGENAVGWVEPLPC